MVTGRRIQNAREERFVKSLEGARDKLDSVIAKAERGSPLTLNALEDFSEQMERVYSQAERIEAD